MKIILTLFAILILSLAVLVTTTTPAIFAQEKDPSKIPGWVKGIADWWVQGNISDDEFLDVIEYLINEGMIQVKTGTDIVSNSATTAVTIPVTVSPTPSPVILDVDWRNGVTTRIVSNDYIHVSSNGVPDTDYSDIPARNPHEIQEQNFNFKFPINPKYVGDEIPTNMGPIGIMLSGVVFFNMMDRDGNDANRIERFDSCNGHVDPLGIYHTHQLSGCFEDSFGGSHSKIFGFVLDGFAVYGYNGINGVPPTDLDDCNGHKHESYDYHYGYHYHATTTVPYLIGCYNGILD